MTSRLESGDGDKDLERLESDIQKTRSAISRDIGTLGDKLTPERIKEDAREALTEAKDAGIQKVREAKERVVETASEKVQAAGARARELRTTSADFMQRNVVPLGLIGLGIGLLARNLRSVSDWGRYEQRVGTSRDDSARQPQENVGASVGGKARELEQRMERRAESMRADAEEGFERAQRKAQEITIENPLATGTAALLAGVGVGFLLPMTRRENELMGNERDRLTGEARNTLRQVQGVMKDTAGDVRGALSDTVHH